MQNKLISFIQQEFGLSGDTLQFAIAQSKCCPEQIHMVLWQYGLVSLEQLNRVFDWLETA
ncbi:MAG: DUF2949 domain-containing protein [Cyanobacteria bacterium J083]|nr:MAG: DUF2949 domain-containing protein [Cyanobacteria bacterium J083]